MKSKLSLRYCIIYTTEKQFRSNKNPKIKENIYLKKQLDARLSSSLQQISFAEIFQRLSPFRNSLFGPFFWEMNINLTLWDVMLQYQTFSEYSVYRNKESSHYNIYFWAAMQYRWCHEWLRKKLFTLLAFLFPAILFRFTWIFLGKSLPPTHFCFLYD